MLLQTKASTAASGSDFNATDFLITQRLARINTSLPVMVMAVHGGGVSAPCFVDIMPMVNQVDGGGAAIPHGTVFNSPVFRLQGGSSAFIIDPVVGDIGTALFCHRDISVVKATKAAANPGSRRKFSLSDGIYLGGVLNGAASQYVFMSPAGIKVVTTNFEVDAATITLKGNVATTGSLTNNSKNVGSTHDHGGVQGGNSVTGPPV